MTTSLRRIGKLAVVLAPLALVGACSTFESEDRVMLQRTNSNSEQALAEARRASENAAQALAAARQAQATGQQALSEAQAARAEARAANEKFDRAHRRGMNK